MDSVDLKGIAWVGNVFQKFESMCLEVEETMYQETAKYVENQVQTVGASMKRFYSDVVQDLHPPSSTNNVKVSSADLLPNPYADVGVLKKPNEYKEHAKKHEQVKGFSENSSSPLESLSLSNGIPKDHSRQFSIGEEGEVVCDGMVEIPLSLASAEVVSGQFREAKEEKVCHSSLDADDTSSDSVTSSAVSHVETSVRKGEEANGNGLMYDVGSHSSGDMQHSQSTNEEISMPDTGDANVDKIENKETRDIRNETNGKGPMSKLEETCVLVVGENVHSEFSSQKKNKSYKKKIRQAFSLKLKSMGRKEEYEQLAAQHVNNITRSNIESVETELPSLSMKTNSKNSQAHDLSESEWELL